MIEKTRIRRRFILECDPSGDFSGGTAQYDTVFLEDGAEIARIEEPPVAVAQDGGMGAALSDVLTEAQQTLVVQVTALTQRLAESTAREASMQAEIDRLTAENDNLRRGRADFSQ